MAVSLVFGPKDLTECWKTKKSISCILISFFTQFIQLSRQALIYSGDTLFCIPDWVIKHLEFAFFLLSFLSANENS